MNNTLKTIVWITAGVAVVSLSIAAVLFFTTGMAGSLKPGNGISVDEQNSFAAGGIDHVTLRTSRTNVYVAAGGGDAIRMRLHGTVCTGEPDAVPPLAAEKIGELLDISLERRDGRKWALGFFSTDLILEITIPQSYRGALAVNTSSGDVDIKDQNLSELSVHTSSGDLRLNSIQATTVALESPSGDHSAEGFNAGQATIKSSSGEIWVGDMEGGVRAESSSGDITLRCREFTRNVDVKSSSGDVDLLLTESAGFQVEARASSGDIDCAYPVTLSGTGSETRKNRLYGTVGTGTRRVSVTTSSGDITIRP